MKHQSLCTDNDELINTSYGMRPEKLKQTFQQFVFLTKDQYSQLPIN